MTDINEKIEFKYTDNKHLYIQIGKYGRLTFSKITSHPMKGYKYMCFSHEYTDVINFKNTNKKRKTINIPSSNSYTINMYLERQSKGKKPVGLPHNTLPGRVKDYLKKKIKPLLDEKGYLHYSYIDTLKKSIDNKPIKDILDKVQKKRKSRKK
jgi:hypothetical protein